MNIITVTDLRFKLNKVLVFNYLLKMLKHLILIRRSRLDRSRCKSLYSIVN